MSMRWEDERYVRVYTRDTATWKLLSWEGRAVLALLFRKADRAGLAELGDDSASRAEALAALLDLPVEVAEPGLASILARKVALLIGPGQTTLLIPNFLAAQEAHSSDAQRKRDQRERAAAQENLAEASRSVTSGHASGPSVTTGHRESQLVTPSLTYPIDQKEPRPEPAAPGFDFEAVYQAYPRKEGKKRGLASFRSQITSQAKYDRLKTAVKVYAASVTDVKYAKHFDTFMGCWEDYVDAKALTPRASGIDPSRPRPPPVADYLKSIYGSDEERDA